MRRGLFTYETLRKAANLFRDHSRDQIVNTFRFGYHVFRGFPTTHLPYAPIWLILFITARCNISCLHCPRGSPESPRGSPAFDDMTIETFTKILNRFPHSINIGLTGGEPLLHPQLFDMIHLAHDCRMKVHIFTNGTRLADNLEAFLEAPVELLNLSLYGTDAVSFSQLTGAKGSAFADIIMSMEKLANRRHLRGYPRIFRASFICTKENLDQAIDFVRLCEKFDLDQVKLKNLAFFSIPGFDDSLCLHEDDQEVQHFIARLRRERFRIPVALPRLYPADEKSGFCDPPFRQLSIDGNGFIGQCCVEGTDKRWNNFFDEPDIWNGPTMINTRRQHLDPTRSWPAGCLHCEEMIQERPIVKGWE